MRESSSVRLICSLSSTVRSAARADGRAASCRCASVLLARRELGLILRVLSLLDPCFDLLLGLGDRRQAHLASFEFLRDRHPIGKIRRIGLLGELQQLLHFPLQLLLQLLGMTVGERAVPARIGVNLGPIQRHRAELEHPHRACQLQHLNEQRLDLRQKALAKVAMVS